MYDNACPLCYFICTYFSIHCIVPFISRPDFDHAHCILLCPTILHHLHQQIPDKQANDTSQAKAIYRSFVNVTPHTTVPVRSGQTLPCIPSTSSSSSFCPFSSHQLISHQLAHSPIHPPTHSRTDESIRSPTYFAFLLIICIHSSAKTPRPSAFASTCYEHKSVTCGLSSPFCLSVAPQCPLKPTL